MGKPICSKTQLDSCYQALEKRLRREDNELCRVAILAWMGFTAEKFGSLLHKHFKELLPHMLVLANVRTEEDSCRLLRS